MNDNHYVGKILRRRYKILQKIGEGGYGDTYRAIDCDYPGQPHCVVKHFKPKNTLHPSMLEIAKGKFNQEAEILSRLGKSNKQIPKLCAYFEENEQFFLVQEFIDGHDLSKEIFAQGYFDTEQKVLQLLIEVLEVLAFVHQQNVIHRDIKPHNIMRRKDGKVVLIDFGAVKQVVNLGVNSQGQTCLTVTIGTPGYMPIEQQSGHPDFSSDIYALGIIGFQALASLNSFNVNPVRLPRDFDTGEFSCAMLPGWSNISPAFAQILDKMVRYDYRERYENASQALEELQNLQRGNQASRVAVTSSSYANTISSQNPQNANFNGNVSIESDESETSSFQKIAAFFRGSSSQTSSFQRIIGFLRDVLLIDYEPDTFPQLPAASNPAVVPSDAASNPAAIPSPAVVPSPAAVSSPGVNSNHYEQPEGQVSLSSVFYIERPPIESDCYGTILQPGALICIKAPRQMGKTSLLSRTLNYARQQGNQAAYLNFQSADAQFLNSFDKFLQWFCGSIAQELNLPDRLDQYWQGVLGSKNKSTNYFQRYLLSEIKTPLILGLDEVDQLFQYPEVAAEFFALLRAWHEKAKNEVIWQKLRLAIVHSKEVYIPLNINQSPFNVGSPIELPEFTHLQVQYLVKRHRLNLSQEEVEQLMSMVGGHPYLVRIALFEIARGRITLPQFLQLAPTEQGMFSDHLRRHLYNLQEDTTLVTAMKQVIASNQAVRLDTGLAFKLRSMGLVKFQGNDVTSLCNLYRLYFRENLSR